MSTILSVFKALADPTRLRLFRILARHELTVTELTVGIDQSQPRISRHLKLLCEASLVHRFQEGSWVFYRLASLPMAHKMAELVLSSPDPLTEDMCGDESRIKAIHQFRSERARDYFRVHAEEWETYRRMIVKQDLVDGVLETFTQKYASSSCEKGVLVDLGTGTGHVLVHLGRKFLRGIGIDRSPEMLTVARSVLDHKPEYSHLQARRGHLEALPLEDAVADVATLHLVLHYVNDPWPVLKEAVRILKQGGLLCIADFEAHSLDSVPQEPEHKRLGFEDEILMQWGQNLGLILKEAVTIPAPFQPDTQGVWPNIRLWAFQKQIS